MKKSVFFLTMALVATLTFVATTPGAFADGITVQTDLVKGKSYDGEGPIADLGFIQVWRMPQAFSSDQIELPAIKSLMDVGDGNYSMTFHLPDNWAIHNGDQSGAVDGNVYTFNNGFDWSDTSHTDMVTVKENGGDGELDVLIYTSALYIVDVGDSDGTVTVLNVETTKTSDSALGAGTSYFVGRLGTTLGGELLGDIEVTFTGGADTEVITIWAYDADVGGWVEAEFDGGVLNAESTVYYIFVESL